MPTRFALFCLVLSVLSVPTRSLAQNTEDQNNFDFSLPGARSRGIGGAFVAVADDATSAYSNPAGLTLLFRPEISVEGRYWHLTSRTIDRGHGFGPATGIGTDTIEGFVDRDFQSNVVGLSFLSFVYPSDRWALGAFRHQLARYEMDRQIVGPFFDCSGGFRDPVNPANGTEPFCEPHAMTDGVDREFPKLQSIDLDIHSYGTAFAYKFSEQLSAGVAVQFFDFSLTATNKVFQARGELGQKYAPPDYTEPDNIEGISTQRGDDHAWAMNAGVLWNVAPKWVVGGSFRQGPKFAFATRLVSGPRAGNVIVNEQPDNSFHVPDTFSVGVMHRLTDFWHLTFEYDWINYQQLIEDFRNTAVDPTSPEGDLVIDRARIDDANQFRFGAERLVLMTSGRVLALRGGIWHEPNHQTYFESDPSTGLPAPRWAVLLPRREGSWHVSTGVGLTTRRHFQIDAAVDFSDLVDTLAISAVWRF